MPSDIPSDMPSNMPSDIRLSDSCALVLSSAMNKKREAFDRAMAFFLKSTTKVEAAVIVYIVL